MKLVAGLGNPGPQYVDTRHNVGFLVVDRLARRAAAAIDSESHGARVGKARVAGDSVLLVKPWTYMNRSGGPVQSLAAYYKADPADVVVVHDDLDLPFGTVRVKKGGGHGGHNGLRDLNKHLGADYVRVRCGLGRPPKGWDPANYVLGRWSSEEAVHLEEVVDTAADAVESVLAHGPDTTMNRFNVRDPEVAAPSTGDASASAGS